MNKPKPTPPNRRDFPAKYLDIFTMMEVVTRAMRGESHAFLAKEYGVGRTTIMRWAKTHRGAYEKFMQARAYGYTQKDLEQILDMLGVLKGQVTRMEAVLTRIVRPSHRYREARHEPVRASALKKQ